MMLFDALWILDENLVKYSDFNHTKKNITNKLVSLRKDKKYSNVCPKAIQHEKNDVPMLSRGDQESTA